MNNPMAYVHNENHANKNDFFCRRFWVKEPRHSENVSAKKRYTSVVARVENERVLLEGLSNPARRLIRPPFLVFGVVMAEFQK